MNMKLYNLFFPLWMLLIMPKLWIWALPSVFVLNTIVFLLSMKYLKEKNIVEHYKNCIPKLWLFNFIGIFAGSLLLVLLQMLPTSNEFISSIVTSLIYNPFNNVFGVIITLLAILLSAFVFYKLNCRITFKDIKIEKKKKLAVLIAIFTAPYLFFYPAENIYSSFNLEDEILLNKIASEFSGNTLTTRIFAESQNYTNTNFKYIDKIAKVDSDIIESSKGSIVNMKISTDFDESADREEYEKWAKQCSVVVFIKQPNMDEVVVNLKSDIKDICKLTYVKEDLEREFGIKLEELEHDSEKMQKVLDSIME